MTTIESKLAEIEALVEKATAGRWRSIPGDSYDAYPSVSLADGEHRFIIYDHSEPDGETSHEDFKYPGINDDAEFIAAAREIVPRLVKALRHSLETASKLPVNVRFDKHPAYIAERHAELLDILEGRE